MCDCSQPRGGARGRAGAGAGTADQTQRTSTPDRLQPPFPEVTHNSSSTSPWLPCCPTTSKRSHSQPLTAPSGCPSPLLLQPFLASPTGTHRLAHVLQKGQAPRLASRSSVVPSQVSVQQAQQEGTCSDSQPTHSEFRSPICSYALCVAKSQSTGPKPPLVPWTG